MTQNYIKFGDSSIIVYQVHIYDGFISNFLFLGFPMGVMANLRVSQLIPICGESLLLGLELESKPSGTPELLPHSGQATGPHSVVHN